jgi:multidrug resistance efflux pump
VTIDRGVDQPEDRDYRATLVEARSHLAAAYEALRSGERRVASRQEQAVLVARGEMDAARRVLSRVRVGNKA